MNLGVDAFKEQVMPERYSPGIGLRPGAKFPSLEPLVAILYAAMYESIAAHSRLCLNVVVDVGHHDDYSAPSAILAGCARRLDRLPVLFVGVRCSIEVIWERRRNTWLKGQDVPADAPVPEPVHRWQREVHKPGIYDMEVDTSLLSPTECAQAIRRHLDDGPAPLAFRRLAEMQTDEAEC